MASVKLRNTGRITQLRTKAPHSFAAVDGLLAIAEGYFAIGIFVSL